MAKITCAYGETFKSKNEKGNYFRVDISVEDEFKSGNVRKYINSQLKELKLNVLEFKKELLK